MYTLFTMGKVDLDERIYQNFLRVLKEHFGDSTGKLAAALRVKQSVVSDYRHRRRKLSNNYIERISMIALIDPMEFFKGPATPMVTEIHEERAVYRIREAKNIGEDVVNQIEVVTDAVLTAAKRKGQSPIDKEIQEGLAEIRRRTSKKAKRSA